MRLSATIEEEPTPDQFSQQWVEGKGGTNMKANMCLLIFWEVEERTAGVSIPPTEAENGLNERKSESVLEKCGVINGGVTTSLKLHRPNMASAQTLIHQNTLLFKKKKKILSSM